MHAHVLKTGAWLGLSRGGGGLGGGLKARQSTAGGGGGGVHFSGGLHGGGVGGTLAEEQGLGSTFACRVWAGDLLRKSGHISFASPSSFAVVISKGAGSVSCASVVSTFAGPASFTSPGSIPRVPSGGFAALFFGVKAISFIDGLALLAITFPFVGFT